MGKPRLLDLFCCAGGAGMGYSQAGFDVVGVDIEHRRRYPFKFIQADVLRLDPKWIRENFDAVHASPPCQFATLLKHAPNGKAHKNLIIETRWLIRKTGLPYVIENVEPARGFLERPRLLCGSMFGLGAGGYQLRRHRLFEANFLWEAPCECQHTEPVIGVYGAHVRCRSAKHGGRKTRDFVDQDKPALARKAMGMDWATMAEMSEAIPPAYTKHIGGYLAQHLKQSRRAAA